jgi:hypothetical protein
MLHSMLISTWSMHNIADSMHHIPYGREFSGYCIIQRRDAPYVHSGQTRPCTLVASNQLKIKTQMMYS